MGRLLPIWIAVVVVASALTAYAQLPPGRQPAPGFDAPRVLSGDDVGFRVEGTDPATGRPVGTWMVRMNGGWVEAAPKPMIRPAK